MVVEHIFITTLDCDDALLLADALFADLGLDRTKAADGGTEWTAGRDRPRSFTNSFTDFRRTVRIGFDRGRITLAASAPMVQKPQEKLYQPYLLALASAVEAHISQGEPVEQAAAPVRAAFDAIRRRERYSRVAVYVVLGIVFLVVLAIVITAIL